MEGFVRGSVTAGVEPVSVGFAAAGWDRAGGAERREGCLPVEAVDVRPGGGQQLRRGLDADPDELEGRGRDLVDQFGQQAVELGDLGGKFGDASGDGAQRDLDGGVGVVEVAGVGA